MDFKGQKLAEQLCLYIICAAGAVAFVLGWLEGSFALMMKVWRHVSAPACTLSLEPRPVQRCYRGLA